MVLNERLINILTGITLVICNGVMLFFSPLTPDRIVDVGIATIGLLLVIFFKPKSLFWAYTLIGIAITVAGTSGNFSGIIFFFFSIYDRKKMYNYVFNAAAILVSLCFKAKTPVQDFVEPPQIFAMLGAFAFTGMHLYARFWPSVSLSKTMTVEQRQTIGALLKGMKHQEAADKFHITRGAYSARVTSLRKKYGIESDFQLAIEMIKHGDISINGLPIAKICDNNGQDNSLTPSE